MADTLVSTLYPPEIETFQPAFDCTKSANVTFSLSAFNSINDIKFIHVSIVDNRNNENVLPSYLAPQAQSFQDGSSGLSMTYGISNGILYMEMPKFTNTSGQQTLGLITYDADKNKYMVSIPPKVLNYSMVTQTNISDEENQSIYYWRNNRYYKVQIRFDSNPEVDAVSSADSPNNDNFEGGLNYTGTGSSLDTLSLINYMYTYREYFSEWSTVTLIKPIAPLTVKLNLPEDSAVTAYPGFFRVIGNIYFDYDEGRYSELTQEEEHLKEYQILITLNDELIFDSGTIYAIPNYADNRYGINTLVDLNDVDPRDELNVKILLVTNNNYKKDIERNIFINDFADWFTNNDLYYWNDWSTNSSEDKDKRKEIFLNEEDGCSIINFKYEQVPPIKPIQNDINNNLPIGTCYIYRACSKDNFKIRDIIYKYQYVPEAHENIEFNFKFEDYTLCSLYQYKYYAQYEDMAGNWSPRHESGIIYPKFYDMLLMRQNRQIAIRYNGQISSWKPTVNRQKVDTLGGKYPKFVENAAMNYKTFQISGLISAEGDHNRKFMNELADANVKYYDEEFNTTYLIRNDTAADGENLYPDAHDFYRKMHQFVEITLETGSNPQSQGLYEYDDQTQTYSLTSDTTVQENKKYYEYQYDWFELETDYPEINSQHDSYPHDHWYWERIFREELTNWLNDGDPKLYRSMPEGNVAVMLTDINLTPNAQLGRRLYNFSATLYEVGDGYSLEQLDKLGIINIPKIDAIYLDENNSDVPVSSDSKVIWKTGFGVYIKHAGDTSLDIVNSLESSYNSSGRAIKENVPDIWDNISIYERISQTRYTGIGAGYCIKGPQSGIGLVNSVIQFTTTPHFFYYDGSSFHRVSEIIDGDDNLMPATIYGNEWDQLTIAEQTQLMRRYINTSFNQDLETLGTLWLGYVVQINDSQIFINEKGYYQIPKNMIVYHLQFDTDDSALFNYEYQYIEGPSSENSPSIISRIRNTLGQMSDIFYPETDIVTLSKRLYAYQNLKNNTTQYIENWRGMSLDVTPYSVFSVKYTNINEPTIIYVGRTGVLDLLQDTSVDNLTVLGRRMIIVKNDRQPYLDSWECVIDNSGESYPSIEAIINPKYNTIYTINNITQIYYMNGHWYDVDIDNSTAIAKIPIEGMINYIVDVFSRRQV